MGGMKTTADSRKYLSVREAALELRVSKTSIYRSIEAGQNSASSSQRASQASWSPRFHASTAASAISTFSRDIAHAVSRRERGALYSEPAAALACPIAHTKAQEIGIAVLLARG
jgi:hypothetical protein